MSVWRLSDVSLSVTYIGPKSEMPRKTKIGTEVAHVTLTRTPLSRSKARKSTCRGGAYCGGLPHSLLLKVWSLLLVWVSTLFNNKIKIVHRSNDHVNKGRKSKTNNQGHICTSLIAEMTSDFSHSLFFSASLPMFRYVPNYFQPNCYRRILKL